MDKIFLHKLGNMSDISDNTKAFTKYFEIDVLPKDYTISPNGEFIDFQVRQIFTKRIKEMSYSIVDATKFFINKNAADFVVNNISEILKMDIIKNNFYLPTDNPLLIQHPYKNSTILIQRLDFDQAKDFGDYRADFLINYKDTNKILVNPFISFTFNKDIFQHYYNNSIRHLEYVSFGLDYTEEWLHNRKYKVWELITFYFALCNLQKDINFIGESKVSGIKKQPYSKFSLTNFLRRPVYEHKVLNINLAKSGQQNLSHNKVKTKIRLHDVRGHLRQLKNGKVVWVNPYKRGDASAGIITKDYKLSYAQN